MATLDKERVAFEDEMAREHVRGYLRIGLKPEQILKMSRLDRYPFLHAVFERQGPEGIRALVREARS